MGINSFSFFHYNHHSSVLLKKIKYGRQFWLLNDFLLQLSWSSWEQLLNNVRDLNKAKLVYVPLSRQSYHERGFNQSLLIANYIGQCLGSEILGGLVKTKNNQKQAMLKNWSKRQLNVNNVYQVKKHFSFKNKSVVIVDDVITSGSTVNEIAKLLKASGAKNIQAVSLFRGG